MREFDWLRYCVSCNIDCCHNDNPYIAENECIRKDIAPSNNLQTHKAQTPKESIHESYDTRPLECRLFPFDVKEIEGEMTWVMWNNCHATPKLNYENFIGFFERKFSREIPLEQITEYVASQKQKNYASGNKKGFTIIRALKWPTNGEE